MGIIIHTSYPTKNISARISAFHKGSPFAHWGGGASPPPLLRHWSSSSLDNQELNMTSRHKVVNKPWRHPNCLGSILCLISSKIHSTTNSPRTFDMHDVSETGHRSFFYLGGVFFGIGEIFADFQWEGLAEDKERLKISAGGSDNS